MQDGGDMTWEPSDNLSEDLIRDFEEAFWQACKVADTAFLKEALQYGGETLANIVNEDGRAALHFAAALNHKDLISHLLEAGTCYNPQHLRSKHREIVLCSLNVLTYGRLQVARNMMMRTRHLQHSTVCRLRSDIFGNR
jgi:hypothetical protein